MGQDEGVVLPVLREGKLSRAAPSDLTNFSPRQESPAAQPVFPIYLEWNPNTCLGVMIWQVGEGQLVPLTCDQN